MREAFLAFVFLLALCAPFAFAQEFQPIPVSEYAEKTGPNTMTFLSYPKYYKTAEGELTPVVTDLVESKSADWDFEVETGIWTLRVKTDGTFQAEHEGNVFTYRLSKMGVGRGDGFQAFEWGEPSWKNYQVIGDAIRWYDVFPKIDLKVRYIHDILKVDVIVKAELIGQIRAEVLDGKLNADDYLTARFDIPNVWVTGEARQGGEVCDLYAERLDVQQPVEFVKDGKVVQKLRPVETYVLDEKGEPIISFEEDGVIRSAQTWQLKKDASGVAEMSACLGDLAKAKDGDVVIDPSLVFTSGSPYKDSCIANLMPTSNDGSGSTASWGIGYMGGLLYDYRLLFAFDLSSSSFLFNANIHSASLEFYAISQSASNANAKARVYKLKQDWDENTVTWQYPWTSNYGGNFENPKFMGRIISLPTEEDWIRMDVTQTLKSHIIDSGDETNLKNRGFIVKGDTSTIGAYVIAMKEYSTSGLRPRLTIEYGTTQFGAWGGYPYDTPAGYGVDVRQNTMDQDQLKIIRYDARRFDSDPYVTASYAQDFVKKAYDKGMEVLLVFGAGESESTDPAYFSSSSDYANYIEYFLGQLSPSPRYSTDTDPIDFVNTGTIKAIEIGAEEEASLRWARSNGVATETGGSQFAEFYMAAWDKIRDNSNADHNNWKKIKIIGGGGVEDWKYVTRTDLTTHSKSFIIGYLDTLTTSSNMHRVPDMFAVHSYTGHYSQFGSGGDWNEFHTITDVLYSMCSSRGYIPSFAITEYGYGATLATSGLTNSFSPYNKADNYTQAIYYLQSRLIHACMTPAKTVGMEYSTYFVHPRPVEGGEVVNSDIKDWGFMNFDYISSIPSYPGTFRAARCIANELGSATHGVQFSNPNLQVWQKIETKDDPLDEDGTRIAWCGVSHNDNNQEHDRWLIVWKYNHSINFYENSSGSNAVITLEGNYEFPYTAQTYRFTINQSPEYNISTSSGYNLPSRTGSAEFCPVTINGFNVDYSNGYTTFTIPTTNENPIFIHLTQY